MSDETTPQDSAAMPPASAGSDALERSIRGVIELHRLVARGDEESQVADAIRDELHDAHSTLTSGEAEAIKRLSAELERLHLTDDERHAIRIIRGCAVTRAERFLTQSDAEREATLTLMALLERVQ